MAVRDMRISARINASSNYEIYGVKITVDNTVVCNLGNRVTSSVNNIQFDDTDNVTIELDTYKPVSYGFNITGTTNSSAYQMTTLDNQHFTITMPGSALWNLRSTSNTTNNVWARAQTTTKENCYALYYTEEGDAHILETSPLIHPGGTANVELNTDSGYTFDNSQGHIASVVGSMPSSNFSFSNGDTTATASITYNANSWGQRYDVSTLKNCEVYLYDGGGGGGGSHTVRVDTAFNGNNANVDGIGWKFNNVQAVNKGNNANVDVTFNDTDVVTIEVELPYAVNYDVYFCDSNFIGIQQLSTLDNIHFTYTDTWSNIVSQLTWLDLGNRNILRLLLDTTDNDSCYAVYLDNVNNADVTLAAAYYLYLNAAQDIVINCTTGYEFSSVPTIEGDLDPSNPFTGVLSNINRTVNFNIPATNSEISVRTGTVSTVNADLIAVTQAIAPGDVDFQMDTPPANCSYYPDPISYNSGATGCTLILTADAGYYWTSAPEIYDSNNVSRLTAVLSAGGTIATFTFDESDLESWSTYDSLNDVYVFDCIGDAVLQPPSTMSPLLGVWVVDDVELDSMNQEIFIDNSGANADAINSVYSLKQFYVIVPTNGSATMRAGKYAFGFSSDFVGFPYQGTENLGTVVVPENPLNALGFPPYVTVKIYLPFIGMVSLDGGRVIGKTLKLYYKIDYVSGGCLACLYEVIDNVETLIFEQAGNIAIDLPVRVSYSQKGNEHIGNIMVLGEKTPYIEITNQPPIGGTGESIEGVSSDEVKTVGSCSGYVKFKKIIVDGINTASKRELDMIEQMLLSGVIV